MSDKVKYNDLFSEDVEKGLDSLLETSTKLLENFKKMSNDIAKASQQNPLENFENVKEFTEDMEKFNKVNQAVLATEKKIAELELERQKVREQTAKANKEESSAAKEKLKNETAQEREIQKLIKQEEKKRKELEKLNSVYEQSKKKLNDVSKRLIELELRGRTNTKTYALLRAEFERLDKNVRRAEESVGRFGRSVGNYREAIQDALEDTGLFNNGIGKLIKSLKALKENQEKAGEASSKLGTALKISGVGLVIAALAAVGKGLTLVRDNSQTVKDAFEKGAAAAEAYAIALLIPGQNAEKARQSTLLYFNTLIGLRGLFRELSKDINKLTLDEEDLREINADQTIGIKQRTSALKEAQQLAIERADTEVKVAKLELGLARLALKAERDKVGEKAALTEFLEKEFEANEKLKKAEDTRNDLERINATERRQLLETQLSLDIELLRSKKNSTKLQSEELQKQIDNERNALDEREAFAKEQISNEREITNLIINRIKETAKEEIKLNTELSASEKKAATQKINNLETEKLLREGNAVILENEIKQAGLSVQLTTDLAAAIKKAQDAEFKGEENLRKIEEDRIKLKARLIELENERQQIIEEGIINEIESRENTILEQQAKLQEDLLKGEQVFNESLLEEKKTLHDASLVLIEAEYKERKKLLDLQLQAEIAAVDASVKAEEEKDAEKTNILEKHKNSVVALEKEKTAEVKKENETDLENTKIIYEKRLDIVTNTIGQISTELQNELDSRNQNEQDAADAEIDRRQTSLERQQELAEKGFNNAAVLEEQKLRDAELKKRQLEEQAQKQREIIQLTESYFNFLNARSKEDANSAPYLALKDTLLAKGVAKGISSLIPSRFDGTEDTGGPGNIDEKGGKLFILHPHERVLSREQNEKIGKISNEELANIAYYHNNNLLPNYVTKHDAGLASNVANTIDMIHFANITKELQELKHIVANKTENHFQLDNFGNLIKQSESNGVRTTIKYISRKPRI